MKITAQNVWAGYSSKILMVRFTTPWKLLVWWEILTIAFCLAVTVDTHQACDFFSKARRRLKIFHTFIVFTLCYTLVNNQQWHTEVKYKDFRLNNKYHIKDAGMTIYSPPYLSPSCALVFEILLKPHIELIDISSPAFKLIVCLWWIRSVGGSRWDAGSIVYNLLAKLGFFFSWEVLELENLY